MLHVGGQVVFFFCPQHSFITFSFISFPFVSRSLIPTSGFCWYEACRPWRYCWCLLVLLLFSKLHLWRTKPFSSNMNPAVCLSTGGGERDKAASVVYRWTRSRLTLAAFQTSYRLPPPFLLSALSLFPSLIFLSHFSLCSLYQSLAPSSPSFIFSCIALVLHSSVLIFYATLFAPSFLLFSFLSFMSVLFFFFLSFFLLFFHILIVSPPALPSTFVHYLQ